MAEHRDEKSVFAVPKKVSDFTGRGLIAVIGMVVVFIILTSLFGYFFGFIAFLIVAAVFALIRGVFQKS